MTTPSPQPFYFGAAGAESFGWLHAANADSRAEMGLVICSPFGDEDQAAHRGLRRLAIDAAERGIATLRFDYPGSGDSAGADAEHDHPSAWLRSVHLAIDTLRARAGVTRVCLLGARLGVLPAAQAASERDDVCALVALAPVVRGQGFLREALLRSAQPPRDAHGEFELGGHVVSVQARAELAAADLLRLPHPPAVDVLVVDSDALHASERWQVQLGLLGAQTEAFIAPTLADLLEAPADPRPPVALIARLVGWIGARAVQTGRATAAAPRPLPACTLQLDGARETPLALNAGGTELFAILSEPDACPARRGVVLLNTGAARRVGPGRLYVNLARRWAREGIAVLRLDLPGLGDSAVQPGDTEGEVYAIRTTAAVAAALDLMRARLGPVDCQLLGICSGAYHAYRAALAGLDLQSVVLINQAAYHWPRGMRLSEPALALRLAWVRKERGRHGTSCPRGMTLLQQALHALRWRGLLAGAAVCGALRDATRGLRLPLPQDVGAALQALARRGVAIHIVVADHDRADALLHLKAGRAVAGLQRRGELQLDIVEGADHIFTSRLARARLRVVLDRIVHRLPPQPAESAKAPLSRLGHRKNARSC